MHSGLSIKPLLIIQESLRLWEITLWDANTSVAELNVLIIHEPLGRRVPITFIVYIHMICASLSAWNVAWGLPNEISSETHIFVAESANCMVKFVGLLLI